MENAKVLVLSVDKNDTYEAIIDPKNLKDFYKHLNADVFDIATRNIGGKRFDIFVDDMGLLKDDYIVSAIYKDGNLGLVGNLVFANHDSAGNTTGLSDEDIDLIKKNLGIAIVANQENQFDARVVVVIDY